MHCSISLKKTLIDSTRYEIFEYVGSVDAEVLFVAVGDSSAVVRGTVEALSGNVKVGAVIVHLLRPWDSQRFAASVPASGL